MSELPTHSAPAGSDPLLRAARTILGSVAALLIFVMMAITVADVFGRYLLNRPIPGAFEVTEISLAIVIFVALPLVTLENGHIIVSLITERISARAQRIQGFVAAAISAVVLVMIAWRLLRHGIQLTSYGDVTIFLRLPKGPLAFIMAALTVLAAGAAAVLAVRLLTGRADASSGVQL